MYQNLTEPHFFNHSSVYGKIELDASLEGLGACFNNEVYAIPLQNGFNCFNIVHLEMLNVLVVIRVWSHQWTGKSTLIACDNQAVVSVKNTGKTKIWFWQQLVGILPVHDINLKVIHILGKTMGDQYKEKIMQLVPHAKWIIPTVRSLFIDYNI